MNYTLNNNILDMWLTDLRLKPSSNYAISHYKSKGSKKDIFLNFGPAEVFNGIPSITHHIPDLLLTDLITQFPHLHLLHILQNHKSKIIWSTYYIIWQTICNLLQSLSCTCDEYTFLPLARWGIFSQTF